MRRFILILLCCLMLTTAVSAANSVTDLKSDSVFSSSGACDFSLTVTLQLDSEVSKLQFPLPETARDITVNGNSAKTVRRNSLRWADLSKSIGGIGTQTFQLRYSLPDAVTKQRNGKLLLTVPLLSGFSFPIEQMQFSITLPTEVESRPKFTSTYHTESIETLMDCTVEGNVISGTFREPLKDQESVTMTLEVTENMFPQPVAKRWSLSFEDIAMALCALLALIYWLVFLRSAPARSSRKAQEPAGLSAGEVGCRLTGQGVDFTMMVLSWAQMGYLLIHQEDSGRVLLHKRMDMGNERSEFECRFFKNLFGGRRIVDGTGFHYARLARKAARYVPNAKSYYRTGFGNSKVFRAISAGIGLFGGISMAYAFAVDTFWQVFLSIVLGAAGFATAWLIQSCCYTVHLRSRRHWLTAAVCSALWIFFSARAGEWNVAVFVIFTQILAGFAGAYGGRRTEAGKQVQSDLLGLRKYMLTAPEKELQQNLTLNPDYFYRLAPYAMALHADKGFARQFGNRKLPQCTYLTTGMDGHMNAREWNQLLRETVDALDERQKRSLLDRITGR